MLASRRGQFTAEVSQNIPLCREHYKLILRLNSFPATEPGQFVQLLCRELDEVEAEREEEWCEGERLKSGAWLERRAMLRRPF